jgi:hypothetical protein
MDRDHEELDLIALPEPTLRARDRGAVSPSLWPGPRGDGKTRIIDPTLTTWRLVQGNPPGPLVFDFVRPVSKPSARHVGLVVERLLRHSLRGYRGDSAELVSIEKASIDLCAIQGAKPSRMANPLQTVCMGRSSSGSAEPLRWTARTSRL